MIFVRFIFLISIVLGGLTAVAQSQEAEYIYETANRLQIRKYAFDSRFEHLVLASSFSRDEVRHLPFTDRRITKIDLVYTEYHEASDFNQKQLDLARLEKLIAINPQITVNKFFDWNVIGQTGCYSSETCGDFFHGFVIYYEPYYTRETSRSEIDSIKTDLSQLDNQIGELKDFLKVDYQRIDCEYPEMLYSGEYLSNELEKIYSCGEKYKGRVFFDVEIDYNGRPLRVNVKGNLFPCKDRLAHALKYILKWKRGIVIGRQQYGVTAKGFVSFPIRKESVNITSFEIPKPLMEEFHMLQQYAQCVAYLTDTTFTEIIPKVEKKVVSDVLFRNGLHPDLIVVDVTGSMYPYTADLLKWVRLSTLQDKKTFVFFNDGDDKPTGQKVVGQTGGIYSIVSDDFVAVRDKMFEAMRGGGGGDLPENNIEALLYGAEATDTPNGVVMIADNYSFPRDAELLGQYAGELRIILCHTEKGINTRYMDLARKYGFSLHTMQSDIADLEKQKTGADFLIDGFRYRLTSQGYVRQKY